MTDFKVEKTRANDTLHIWYRNVTEFSEKYFTPDRMYKIYSDYYQLLTTYVIGEQGEKTNYTFLENSSDFAEAIYFLKQQVVDRKIVVEEFLSK